MKSKKIKLKKTTQLRTGMIIQNHMDKLFYKVLDVDRINSTNTLETASRYNRDFKSSGLFFSESEARTKENIKHYKGIMTAIQVKLYGNDWDEVGDRTYHPIDNSGYFDAPYVMVVR